MARTMPSIIEKVREAVNLIVLQDSCR